MADLYSNRFERRSASIVPKFNLGQELALGTARCRKIGDIAKQEVRMFFPLKGIIVGLGLFLAFKGIVLAQLGPDEYKDRVERLRVNDSIGAIVAFALSVDPVTQKIGVVVKPYIR
ncbi:MAG: hypothetical protein ABJ327_20325 [Litoreibacter sp.]